MRFPRPFFLCLLPAISLAVKNDLGSRFEDYHAKSLLSAPLKLDDASYDELTGAPRNFSAVVLLTALEARFGCQLCRDFQPEWDLIGRSWARGDKDGKLRVLYGTLDFLDGKGTFQKVSDNYFQRYHHQSLLQMLIVLYSSCYRLLRLCSSSHKPSAPTPRLIISPFDMTSQQGE